jgi:Methionyl-tRNA formyltransferase
MNVLNHFILLGANSVRTKAYLQYMVKSGNVPSQVFLMSTSPQDLLTEVQQCRTAPPPIEQSQIFNINEPILYTLTSNKIPYQFISTDNVNSVETISAIRSVAGKYVIYSGFGGQILKPEVLSLGKKFLHVHPGVVPKYRGSTTVYYSLLKEGTIGASAIFLDEKIDCGAVLKAKTFDISNDLLDFDYIVDPHIRASLLVEVLEEYKVKGYFEIEIQNEQAGETFYIIHPVLKHIALLSLGEL